MPSYDYKCRIHGTFEAQQSIKAPALEECPKCVQAGILEYHCKECDTVWSYPASESESLGVKPSDKHCINCDNKEVECRSPKPKRLISLGSFILKGGGWGSEGYK